MIHYKIKKGHPQFGKIPMRNDEVIELLSRFKKNKKKLYLKDPKFLYQKDYHKTINYYKSVI